MKGWKISFYSKGKCKWIKESPVFLGKQELDEILIDLSNDGILIDEIKFKGM